MKKLLIFLLPFCWLFTSVVAQSEEDLITVTGTVCDKKKEPIEDASVEMKGNASIHTFTNEKGEFSITVPSGTVIEFSMDGYMPEIKKCDKYDAKKPLVVTLDEEVIIDFFGERGGLTVSDSFNKGVLNYAIGYIYDENGKPIEGAVVHINDRSAFFCPSDSTGRFYYPIKKFPTKLYVSYVGCITKQIRVTRRNVKKLRRVTMEEAGAL